MVGPSTRILVLEADAQGRIAYRFGRRQPQSIQLPPEYAARKLAVIDMVRATALISPKTNRLEALAVFLSFGDRIILFGRHWGQWLDAKGQVHDAEDILTQIQQWRVPLTLHETYKLASLEFQINIHQREVFTRETLLAFREGQVRHHLDLQFHYPSGEFAQSRLKILDPQTSQVHYGFDLRAEFPLRWPPCIRPQEMTAQPPAGPEPELPPAATPLPPPPPPVPEQPRKVEAPPQPAAPASSISPAAAPAREEPDPLTIPPWARKRSAPSPGPQTARPAAKGETSSEARPQELHPGPSAPRPAAPYRLAQAPTSPPAPAPARPASRAVPRTENLPTQEMLAVLSTEHEPETRWKIVEANLMLGRPERTYPLILNYCDLISERASFWPPVRLKVAFVHQPGSVLISLMHGWHVNQILALMEDNAEGERILTWLREREIERLLRLDLTRDPVSIEDARQALRIDRHADETAIKKTWRTLLGFMNADHGRSQERPIHRKKDEIAKHLQIARNILLKSH